MDEGHIGGIIYAVVSVVLILFLLDLLGIIHGICWFWEESCNEVAAGDQGNVQTPTGPPPAGQPSAGVQPSGGVVQPSAGAQPSGSKVPHPTAGRCAAAGGNVVTVNPGSSIQQAISSAQGGSTVCVMPGTYDEIIDIANSGSSGSPLRVICDTKWECKIHPTSGGSEQVVHISGSNVEFEGFDITSSADGIRTGLDTNGDYNKVVRNKIHDVNLPPSTAVGSCLGLYDSTGAVLDGNVIFNCGNHPTMDHGVYVSSGDGTLTNNIVYQNAAFGIHLWHIPHDVKIYNNTVFNNGQGGIIVAAVEHAGSFIDGCITANNIVYGNSGEGIVEVGGNTEGSEAKNIEAIGTNIFVNNLVFGNDSDWSLMKNPHTGDITADPMFVNYQADGTGDYHLQAGSPAIDKSDPQYAPPTDADGKSRTGVPDLGAYEM